MQQTQCKIVLGGGGGFACPNRGFIWVVGIYLVLMKPSPIRVIDSVNFVFGFSLSEVFETTSIKTIYLLYTHWA